MRNPTSRSLSVVCLVIMFPKWVFYPNVSSLRVLVFEFELKGGLMSLDPLPPRPSGGSFPWGVTHLGIQTGR